MTINRPLASDFTVVEVAAMGKGHISHARIARPHIGLITNIGISHVANYRNREELFREKVSLLDHLEGDRIGIVHRSVLDEDDANERLIRSKGLSRLLTVGTEADNDVHVLDATFDGIATAGTMSAFGKSYRFRLQFPEHFLGSAMMAMAVAGSMSLELEPLVAALGTATPTPRRCDRYRVVTERGVMEVIDDSINAAPDSIAALLRVLEVRSAGRKVFVLGDMTGLGSDSPTYHKAIAPLLPPAGIDLLITIGTLSPFASDNSIETVKFPDTDAACRGVPSLLKSGDLIAVKGWLRLNLNRVVDSILAMGRSAPVLSWRIEDHLTASQPVAGGVVGDTS